MARQKRLKIPCFTLPNRVFTLLMGHGFQPCHKLRMSESALAAEGIFLPGGTCSSVLWLELGEFNYLSVRVRILLRRPINQQLLLAVEQRISAGSADKRPRPPNKRLNLRLE
jgi:hypothetical protein